ncbi:MAG: 4Fe-4S ferredoxin [Thermoprotei archaeon]|nr:MAG: 4Fe-4S ferredoxin [Thermoprotei archaeon]
MSKVYMVKFDWKATNIMRRIQDLLNAAKVNEMIGEGEIIAIKVHLGERGNFRHPRPQIIRSVVDYVKKHGGKPFVTDTTTLYAGYRGDAVDYLETAAMNGFTMGTINAPVIIADGLRGRDAVEVKVGGELGKVDVAAAIAEADAMIVISHVKFHLSFGFGGALKNLAMGCTARATKFAMHSTSKPTVDVDRCTGCRLCERHCRWEAIRVIEGKARIDYEKCVGCGDCLAICRSGAITIPWDRTDRIQRLAAQAAKGVLMTFEKNKVFYINLLMEVTRYCDCGTFLESPVIPDIGILGSYDPVAIDQASMDLINAMPGYLFKEGRYEFVKPGEDKAKLYYPELNWWVILEEAERLGLGSRKYEIVTI